MILDSVQAFAHARERPDMFFQGLPYLAVLPIEVVDVR